MTIISNTSLIPDPNETVFIDVFGTRSWLHLDAVSNLYILRYKYGLEILVRENLVNTLYDSIMNICKLLFFLTNNFIQLDKVHVYILNTLWLAGDRRIRSLWKSVF